jgi:hypothetical protein
LALEWAVANVSPSAVSNPVLTTNKTVYSSVWQTQKKRKPASTRKPM